MYYQALSQVGQKKKCASALHDREDCWSASPEVHESTGSYSRALDEASESESVWGWSDFSDPVESDSDTEDASLSLMFDSETDATEPPSSSRASSQDATVAKPSKEDIALVSAHNYAPALECCLLNTIANVCFHLMFFVSYPVVFSVCL